MKQITNNTEFIIGIDFGHGETSASFYALHSNSAESKKDLNITSGKDVIKSAVAILSQEGVDTIAVGDRAIQEAPFAKDFQVSFKKRPSEMDDVERARMVAFMRGVYNGILEQYPDFKSREHVVFIARPSQDKLWKNEEAEYVKIAEDAGLPVAGIQKESRAAYFRARTQPDSKIDAQVDDGVLIVDFGSSTIDFTYLNKDLKQPIDDGVALGASAVEETLLKYSFLHPREDDPNLSIFYKMYGKDPHSNAYNQLLYKFRIAKENFYENHQSLFGLDYWYDDLTSAEQNQLSGSGRVRYSKNEVRRILTEELDKYIPKIETAVRLFKEQKLKDYKVACVYLTGGASQMDFVREIFMKVFNLSEEQCPKDDHASVIVSQGVAHLSYADYKTQEKEKELRRKAKEIIDGFDWNGKLKEVIADSVKNSIIDKVYSIMSDYKNGYIYDYHTLNNGKEGDVYYCMEGDHDDGFQKVRNLEALISKFEATFNGYVHYDFVQQCKTLIINSIIDSIAKELKKSFSAFNMNKELSRDIALKGLSASLSQDGANVLKWRFTSKGDGHVLYDAVASCWIAMWGWDLKKDRWDDDRKQHFEYYTQHYKSIYSSSTDWNYFIKNYISISGISSAKEQIESFVDDMITEYISYAKLAIFFK